MTPPTGYRLATADDLTEGAEVLIPATIGDGYARISVRSNRPAADTYISAPRLPGIALVRDDAATTPDDYAATSDRLRRDLANATDEVMQSAGRYGRLEAQVKAAAVLCGIDADGAEERLAALVDRARGGR